MSCTNNRQSLKTVWELGYKIKSDEKDQNCLNHILKFISSAYTNHCDPTIVTSHIPYRPTSPYVFVIVLQCIFFSPTLYAAPANASSTLTVEIRDPLTLAVLPSFA